jgi:hypothetical protein
VPIIVIERDLFVEIIADARRGADALEQYIRNIDGPAGGGWQEQDRIELYQVWLGTGNALRDLSRNQPAPDATEVRPEVVAIRDGVRLIADILARQV